MSDILKKLGLDEADVVELRRALARPTEGIKRVDYGERQPFIKTQKDGAQVEIMVNVRQPGALAHIKEMGWKAKPGPKPKLEV